MIRTLIADSVDLMRTGLLVLLNREPDIKVVAELDRPDLVVQTASLVQPDVAVLDGATVAAGGFAAIRELHTAVPDCGTVVMSSSDTPCDLREAIATRAEGLVMKDSDPDKITNAIRQVAAGKKVVDPDLALAILTSPPGPPGPPGPLTPLTRREADVLRLAAQGQPAMEIAGILYLSVGTVHNLMSRVIGKTGARNRVDAIRIAEGAGWL